MRHSRSGLFLMEMILCILFFALASTVCVQLFTGAHNLSNETVYENQAIIVAQNLAECFYSCEGDLSLITEQYFPDATYKTINSDIYSYELSLYLSENWIPVSANEEASFACTMKATQEDSNGNITCSLSVGTSNYGDGNENIYDLELTYHKPLNCALH